MLFSTYTPPPPPQKNNTLAWVLGICGGCVLLIVIGIGVVALTAGKQISKAISVGTTVGSGAVKMAKSMPVFLGNLKDHDYASAASQVDPASKETLSEEKIKAIEEKMESKLGKLKSFPKQFSQQSQNTTPPLSKDELPGIEYIYSYALQYEKGPATATFHFKTKDMSKFTGMVTKFTIEEGGSGDDSGGDSKKTNE